MAVSSRAWARAICFAAASARVFSAILIVTGVATLTRKANRLSSRAISQILRYKARLSTLNPLGSRPQALTTRDAISVKYFDLSRASLTRSRYSVSRSSFCLRIAEYAIIPLIATARNRTASSAEAKTHDGNLPPWSSFASSTGVGIS